MYDSIDDGGLFVDQTTVTLEEPAGGTAMGYLGGDPDRLDMLVSGICQRSWQESITITRNALTHCYRIGWDLDDAGNASSWSDIQWWPEALNHEQGIQPNFYGGGAPIADVDGTGEQDVILMGIDYRNYYNGCYFYVVGHDIQSNGSVDH